MYLNIVELELYILLIRTNITKNYYSINMTCGYCCYSLNN